MSRPVKFAVSIYLAIILFLVGSYLIMILIGSIQGNDMRGAVLDADNTTKVEKQENTKPAQSDSEKDRTDIKRQHSNTAPTQTMETDSQPHPKLAFSN